MNKLQHTHVLSARLKAQAGATGRGLLASIGELLEERTNQQVTLGEIAGERLLSSRTLRSRLLELNTRFRTLVAEVGANQVRRYLTETSRLLDRIPEQVGYSDAANLRQAVKRWTRESPQVFCSRLRTLRST